MVVCLSSLLARTEIVRKNRRVRRQTALQPRQRIHVSAGVLTGFCYVNYPLVWFDRSPAEVRHVGVSSDWNKMEFFLQDSQLRLERLLRLSERLPNRCGSSFESSCAPSTVGGLIGT